ncbi:hypothetical protein FO519_008961 [Halicephalobus sp. NKZ332]|nr:hypothetical protein FO519_008961 [Halicephalobus sp. NKZ332]
MTITILDKSFGKKTINDSYRSIQVGTPLTRTTSTSVFEYHQRTYNTPVWQPAILEVDYRIPTVINPKTDSAAFRSISAQTLRDLLISRTEEEFNREFVLLDCRYNYEFNGGHIKYAVNFHDNTLVHTLFYPNDETEFRKMNTRVPIFYCEYSQVRGPKMAHELRRFDRRRNEAVYPIVDYPEMYLLDGGYNNFFKLFKKEGLCVPDRYIPMNARKYSGILKKFSFHRTKSQTQKQQFAQDSLVIRRKRRALRVDSGSSEWKILCPCPTMTSTPARKPSLPAFSDPSDFVGSTLVEDEFSKIQSWRQNINGIASTSEWDSSFETSELELSSVIEEKISTEFSFTSQSQGMKEMDLNRSSPMKTNTELPGPAAVKATATAKFPLVGGTAKEVAELKKTVEEHTSTIDNLQGEITLLKNQYEQITFDYQYVLELLEKQNDRLLKLELIKQEYSERRSRYEDRVPRVRERLTVQREYCYSPSAPLSTTIDSTLRKIPDFNREENEHHQRRERNDYQRPQRRHRDVRERPHQRHQEIHHREVTPRVEEVSEEWSNSNEEEYVSRVYSNPRSPQESRIHDQTAGKENIPEVDNMEYTVMQDYYDEDDGLFETSVNNRETRNEHRQRVADRLIQRRR